MDFTNALIAVTGGAASIGSHVVDRLVAGGAPWSSSTTLDRTARHLAQHDGNHRVHVAEADIRDAAAIQELLPG